MAVGVEAALARELRERRQLVVALVWEAVDRFRGILAAAHVDTDHAVAVPFETVARCLADPAGGTGDDDRPAAHLGAARSRYQ